MKLIIAVALAAVVLVAAVVSCDDADKTAETVAEPAAEDAHEAAQEKLDAALATRDARAALDAAQAALDAAVDAIDYYERIHTDYDNPEYDNVPEYVALMGKSEAALKTLAAAEDAYLATPGGAAYAAAFNASWAVRLEAWDASRDAAKADYEAARAALETLAE